MRTAFWVSFVFLAGCGATVTRHIPRNWVGTPYARATTYLAANQFTEYTPPQVAHESVRDEATLATLDDRSACMSVVIRTSIEFDEPLEELSPECDGNTGFVTAETVTVLDHSYVGQREVAGFTGIAASTFMSMSVTQPSAETFRVIERQGQICCPVMPGTREVELSFTNDRMLFNNMSYSQTFEWELGS